MLAGFNTFQEIGKGSHLDVSVPWYPVPIRGTACLYNASCPYKLSFHHCATSTFPFPKKQATGRGAPLEFAVILRAYAMLYMLTNLVAALTIGKLKQYFSLSEKTKQTDNKRGPALLELAIFSSSILEQWGRVRNKHAMHMGFISVSSQHVHITGLDEIQDIFVRCYIACEIPHIHWLIARVPWWDASRQSAFVSVGYEGKICACYKKEQIYSTVALTLIIHHHDLTTPITSMQNDRTPP